MEYSAIPRPWTPHRSICTLSSLDVTRASNTFSCMSFGIPEPSSRIISERVFCSRVVATYMWRAPASRELRSISITMSSTQRISCFACLRSASATRRRTYPAPRFSSMRSARSPPIEATKSKSCVVSVMRYLATSTARDSRMTTTRT